MIKCNRCREVIKTSRYRLLWPKADEVVFALTVDLCTECVDEARDLLRVDAVFVFDRRLL